MNETLEQILDMVDREQVMISNHGYDELAEDHVPVRDIMTEGIYFGQPAASMLN
ncbi:hypothetical protein ACFL1X_03650 [Candidatus Hydrogenedentota bacterium]